MATLLLVEDDKLLNQGICFALKHEHSISSVYSYKEAIRCMKERYTDYNDESNILQSPCSKIYQAERRFDLALLDINLPDGNGLELCKKLRTFADIPVIFLTAKDTPQDIIEGFKVGCDDYIAKPFELEVLKHRIQAVLRRAFQSSNQHFQYKNLVINLDKVLVLKNEVEVKLTPTEYKLLSVLMNNKGQVLTRDSLLSKLWDVDENFVDENTINVNIRRLRQKIEEDPKNPELIITVFGIGYTWGKSG